MQFFVYSRRAIEALAGHDVPYVVISITTTADDVARVPPSRLCRGVLRIAFADIDRPLSGAVMFDASHARAICAFISEHRGSIERIIVHCDAGFSRSPAVAAAIAKCLGEDDAEFFRRYQPNMHVYQTLLDTCSAREDLEHVLYAMLIRETRDAGVGLWELCWECAHREPPVRGDLARELVLHVVRRALNDGAIVAGDWTGDVDDLVARIAAEWRALGRDPEPGEIVSFYRSR
jgi:predicted protein tyrosine phosphatase